MTQFTVARRVAGLSRALHRFFNPSPPAPPAFDTYGAYSRARPSFTHSPFLS